jgi:hypothetical protein
MTETAGSPKPAPSGRLEAPAGARWTVYLAAAVLAVLVVRALVVPLFVWDMLHYPFDYFFNEGDTLFYTLRLMHGQAVYSNSTSLPLLGNIYPPVFLWISAFFGYLVPPSLASDRAFALVPLGITMTFCALFLKRAKVSPMIVSSAVLLIPCCYSMSHFLIMPRCDSWMTAFCIGSLYFLSAPDATRRDLILGGLCSALALFTKQTALFGVFAVHATLLIKQPRKGLAAGIASAVFCVLLLGISLWEFGPVMLEALTMTSGRTFDAGRIVPYYIPTLCALGPIAALALLRARVDLSNRRWDLLDSYVIGHGLQSGLMLFVQSSSNYFLDVFPGLIAASALLVDAWLKHYASEHSASHRKFSSAALVAALLVAAQLWLQRPFENTVTPPDAIEQSQAWLAKTFLTELDEPAYSEHLWGVIADREPTHLYFSESTHAACLKPGHLPAGTLEAPFRERKFGRVMLFVGNAFHTKEVLDAITSNYQLADERKHFLKICFGDAGDLQVQFYVRKGEAIPPLPAVPADEHRQ